MEKYNSQIASRKTRTFIQETDIRILVFGPPIIGFGGFIIWILAMDKITNGHINQPIFDFSLGVSLLITGLSGFFEIYRKEMPGLYGKVIKGKIAVVSGVFIIMLFALTGVPSLIHGIASFVPKR